MFKNSVKKSKQSRQFCTLQLEALEVRECMSTTAPAYLVPSAPGVTITPILTVGDSVTDTYAANGPALADYRMAGIPDGMGAFDNGDGTFTVLLNHEFGSTVGVARDHHGIDVNGRGAFVSRWVIEKSTLQVLEGDDLIKTLYLWDSNPASPTYNQFVVGTGALSYLDRLCSADLPETTAFYNAATGNGTTSRIFMNGEETSNGRAFAHIVTGPAAGTSWELPWTGKYAWENHVTSSFAQDKTVVVGLDDSSRSFSTVASGQPSEVYVWVGAKQNTGSDIEKAGLVHGILHGLRVGAVGSYDATEATVVSGERFELVALTDQTNNATFTPLQTESIAKSITQFRRVEDGAFDPNNPNDFYFVTTDQFGAAGFSKLWRLRFDDITNPEGGGVITLLINGEGVGSNTGFGTGEMFDNIAVDNFGRVLLQEDVGNQTHLGKMWIYDIASGGTLEVARHDPNLFLSTSPNYLGTKDEEASGIIDLSHILGDGYYLFNTQVHRNIEPALAQMGQLLVMHVRATAGIGFDAATNAPALVVLGTQGNDHLKVVQASASFQVWFGVNELGTFAPAGVTKVIAQGYDGNDHIDLSAVQANTAIYGGAGNDHLIGGSGSDWMQGGTGNDKFDHDPADILFDFGDGNDTKRKKK